MILVYLFALAFATNNALRAIARQDYIEAGLWALVFGAVVMFMFGESEKARVLSPLKSTRPVPRPRQKPEEYVPYYNNDGTPRRPLP